MSGDGEWCADVAAHASVHEFCEIHQLIWCRLCDEACVECLVEAALAEPDDPEDES